ncbi:MAG: SBBP repeat-containing protein [Bacteroidia bacterium]|nr:SBBP repeat-containing protein [Bacteroidia bacterium]
MKKILIFFYVISTLGANAQNVTLEWAKGMGGREFDFGKAAVIDQYGNIYTTGSFSDTADFDPGIGNFDLYSSSDNVFVSKLDINGNFIWAKQLAKGAGSGRAYSIALDINNNVYIAGNFAGNVDFDPGSGVFNMNSGSGTTQNAFLVKLDQYGNFVWCKQLAGESCINSLKIKNGNLYAIGYFNSTTDFDPNAGVYNYSPVGLKDIFALNIDTAGNFIWAKQFGGSLDDIANDLAIDDNSNIYLTGVFKGTADCDPDAGTYNLSSNGNDDIFLIKIDSTGTFGWAKQFGGTNYETGSSIDLDSNGNIFICGVFGNTVDFDPSTNSVSLTSIGTADIFILKLNPSGDFVWAKNIGSNSYSSGGYSISVDSVGASYITGFFIGNTDFDPNTGSYPITWTYGVGGPGATYYPDIFILKLDGQGNFVWAKGIGSSGVDYGNKILLYGADVYAVGYFSQTVDFDPESTINNLTSGWRGDIFVIKMNQTVVNIEENEINKDYLTVYPNPAKDYVTIKSTTITDISLLNILGEEIKKIKISKDEIIDISFLSSGIYFLNDKKSGKTFKLIVN